MKKAIVIYRSRKGTTKYFAEGIAEYIQTKNIDAQAINVFDCKPEDFFEIDFVLLGCWTHGLFFFLQHPDALWSKFSKTLPDLRNKKVGLFTTYKIATGSMFRKMKKKLDGKISTIEITLKSKNEHLSEEHKTAIERFIA